MKEFLRYLTTALWLLILMLPFQFAIAQVYNVTAYTSSDGLLQSQVMAILQDDDDFLWLGTHGGLSRYDGKSFENFTPDEGLVGDFVNDLVEDRNGNLWIAASQGVSRYDGKLFTNYLAIDGTGVKEIFAIAEGPDDHIWLGTEEGLIIISPDSLIEQDLPWEEGSLDKLSIHCFLKVTRDEFYIGTQKGLFLWDGSLLQAVFPNGVLGKTKVADLLLDQEGNLWVATESGLVVIKNDTLDHYTRSSGQLPTNQINSLVEDKEGQIWIGSAAGVIRYSEDGFIPFEQGNRSLAYKISSSHTDEEGNIWIGTDGGGVRKITKGVFRSYTNIDGLSSNIAKSFLQSDDGDIWISTYDRGINRIHDGALIRTYSMEDGLGGNDISFSLKDQQGQLWFASYTGGLSKMDKAGGIKVFTIEDGLPSNQLYAMAEYPKGNLWIGTDQGVVAMKGEKVLRTFSVEDGLPDNKVYAIESDGNKMWIGTATGIATLRNGTVRAFDDTLDIMRHTVFDILKDPKGRIWIASSGGLYFYDRPDFRSIRISGAQGAHNVVSLTLQSDSLMWIGTENGAYRVNLNTFRPDQRNRYDHFTQKDGLPSMECNANAGYLDQEGNIWIGTAEGAIMKPAGDVRRNIVEVPRIHITSVRLGLEETNWEKEGFSIDRLTFLPQDLELANESNRLAFDYIGISLKSPKQVEYKYKLEGLDPDWSPSTRETSVSYSNLGAKTYIFKVIAKNEADQWEYEKAASFTFTILPAYYQTWWFWTLVALLIGGLIWLGNLSLRRRRLQKAEEERIKNQAEKLQLEHQALYAMMNPHFTFNALQSIQYFIHRQDKLSANKFLSSFAKLVRKNLESTKSDFITLDEEVDRLKLYLSLERMRFPEKFSYEVNIDPEIDAYNTSLPPMILQPFVENSIKHGIMPLGEGGLIKVDIVKVDEDYLEVLITDNGIGIETSKKLKANRPNDHVSKGMQITMDRLALFARMTNKKYTVEINELVDPSGKVSGTQVKMLLPWHQ